MHDIALVCHMQLGIILTLFSKAQINVNVRIISQNDDELYTIINETDSSIIVKANTFDKVNGEHIVRLEKNIYVPIALNSIENNSIIIVEFDDEDNCITYFGNIIYSLIKYSEKTITNLINDRTLQKLDDYVKNINERGW